MRAILCGVPCLRFHLYDSREWDVYCKETCLVREEAKWCMRREGANGLKNCRALAQQVRVEVRLRIVTDFEGVPATIAS